MPRKSDLLPINDRTLDKRIKLTDAQRVEIKNRYQVNVVSAQKLADEYKVSKRLIQFIVDPSKHEENLKRREERGGTMHYYDREKNKNYMKKHRDYKKQLFEEGKLQQNRETIVNAIEKGS